MIINTPMLDKGGRMFLYKIINKNNGKLYFGITIRTIENRWIRHKSSAKHGSELYLHRAMRKHGFDAFIVEHVQTFTNIQDMKQAEMWYISEFNTMCPAIGYNGTRGGDGTWGRVASDETRQRIKDGVALARAAGKMFSDEWHKNIVAATAKRIGVPLSYEHRNNISAALKGKKKNHMSGKQPTPVDQFSKTGEFICSHACYGDAARAVDSNPSDIMRCCQGKRKTIKGFIFKFH